MTLEQKGSDTDDIDLYLYDKDDRQTDDKDNRQTEDKDDGQTEDSKSKETNSKQMEFTTTPISISHKFKPRKRKIGNLVLKSNVLASGEISKGKVLGDDLVNEYNEKTNKNTFSGILSKLFHAKQVSSIEQALGEPNVESSNITLQDDSYRSNTTNKGLSRIFETYRKRNRIQRQPQSDGYNINNSDDAKSFNRFFKLEQALDAKKEERELLSDQASDSIKKLSVGSTSCDNNQDMDAEFGSIEHTGSKGKINTQFILNDSPKTESELLENTVFSPYTHRPSLRDIPGIGNIETSSSYQNTGKHYSSFRMLFKIGSNKNLLYGTASKPIDPQFKNLEDEIDSHLYCQLRANLLYKCFPNRYSITQNSRTEPPNEDLKVTPDMEAHDKQIPSIPTTSNSLSDNLTNIKEVLQQKFKSSFSRDKSKRQNLSVRFVSPTLSPIQMTNDEKDDNSHNNAEAASQSTI